MAMLTVGIALAGCTAAASDVGGKLKPPPKPTPPPEFAFSPVMGDWMLLQQQPSAAAVYGPVSAGATSVTVTVSDGKTSYDVVAKVGKDATHQPFGYVDPGSGANLPTVNVTWKAMLRPTTAGGDYTITAKCTGCTGNTTATLEHVTFGDMWYCSGQSNMWLPVEYTFSKNKTLAAINSGKYGNIRGMFAPSADTQTSGGSWSTAAQAATKPGSSKTVVNALFDMGATCWYFVQELVDRGVTTPIGIADTAIGGQRIEEFMNNATFADAIPCPDELGGKEVRTPWNGQLFAKQVMPFVDMTVKGWTWYQGENNMDNVKGNAADNVGYSCKQRELVKGWRAIWSETAGTTDPRAPFGIVTLASSGTEGGPNLGAMRLAQTAGYGVLPNPLMPNTFLAQAGDLEDAWGPGAGPCFSDFASQWGCCTAKNPSYQANRSSATCMKGTGGKPELCDEACAAMAGTPTMGGIHPRSKFPVGARLAAAAFSAVYGGTGAVTGPTLSGCTLDSQSASLTVEFNATLLAGETVVLNKYNSSLNNQVAAPPPVTTALEHCFETTKAVCAGNLHNITDCRNCKAVPGAWAKLQAACGSRPINNFHDSCKSFFPANLPLEGSLVEVLIGQDGADGTAAFCVEPSFNGTQEYCPSWAGAPSPSTTYNSKAGKWVAVDIASSTSTSVTIDLKALNGTAPVAVRYSWGIFDCCNSGDPMLYVDKPCDTACPITSSTLLPANPFIAKLVGGKCSCIAPQVC